MTDYSVYLVTDSTMVPESCTFLEQVEKSVNSGATIVQLREKQISTLDFIDRAQKVHEITAKKGIPLIINDRIDVALAIDAEGVHVGQDDMPAKLARQLLGPNKILGVTCSNPQEVAQVCEEDVADYVGIGTLYATATKTDTKTPLGAGPIGIRAMLLELGKRNHNSPNPIRCVGIGGINETNVAKVMYQCQVPGQHLDGVAIVSCIMAKPEADQATVILKQQFESTPPWVKGFETTEYNDCTQAITNQVQKVRKTSPLVHHITNNVVKNFSANITLAIGASPVMSELAQEYEEFATKVPHLALVLNLGTPTPEMMAVFTHALHVYNKYGKHIIFDPVAAGATTARLECCRLLLNAGQMSVIKGNVGEILAIGKLTAYKAKDSDKELMRGVDSIGELSPQEIVNLGQTVSRDFKCVVVVTGRINYVIDGFCTHKVVEINGGSALLGSITGSGCSLGSTIASFVAAEADSAKGDKFSLYEAVVSAVALYNRCGQMAATKASAPGSFIYQFLDELYNTTKE